MKRYLVAGFKMTPTDPDVRHGARRAARGHAGAGCARRDLCLHGFAKRGCGVGAVAPNNLSEDNAGVVESFSTARRSGGVKAMADRVLPRGLRPLLRHAASPTRSRSSTTARSSAGRAPASASTSTPTCPAAARRRVPLLQHGVRRQELALLHARCRRMRDGEGRTRTGSSRRNVFALLRARRRRQLPGRARRSIACTTTARAARPITATRRASRRARRCSAAGGFRRERGNFGVIMCSPA